MRNLTDLAEEVEYSGSEAKSSNLINKIKDRLLLKLEIKEGDEVTVREIAFNNNEAFDDGDLKGEMDEISEAVWWKFWGGGKFYLKIMKKIKS